MRVLHKWSFLIATFALAGCGANAAGPGEPCTAMAARSGISVQVGEQLAKTARTATLTVCQRGSCQQVSTKLRPSTTSVDQGCDGEVCGAKASPTGQRHGFASLPKLTTAKVRLRIILRGEGGPPMEHRVTAKPEAVYPNGPGCGGEAPQAKIRITSTGGAQVDQPNAH